MVTRKNALTLALEKGTLKTRPLGEIEADQDETLEWAEAIAKHFSVKVRRGRPRKDDVPPVSRSVTVRFPEQEAERIVRVAGRQNLSVSEFIRAAAVLAASVQLVPKRSKTDSTSASPSLARRVPGKAPKTGAKR
jgi:hypothetical protein